MSDEGGQRFGELLVRAQDANHSLCLQEALDLYKAADALRPESYDVQVGMARTLTRMRRQEGAAVAVQKALDLEPDRFEAHAALGVLRFLVDDNEEAISALRRAIELEPVDPGPRLTLAQVYSDMKRFDEARAELDRAREMIMAIGDETQRRQLLALAWHVGTYQRISEGKNTEAIECAQEVIALEDANPYAACLAYSNLGILEARMRHYDQAIEYLEIAYAKNPFFHRAGSALGRLLIMRKHRERAVEVLRRTLEHMDTESGSTRYAYALALAKLGKRQEALVEYHRALEEGLSGMDIPLAHWQTIWLSDWGRYTIIGVVLAALLAWILLAKPSLQTLTLPALLAMILILQRTIGRRRR